MILFPVYEFDRKFKTQRTKFKHKLNRGLIFIEIEVEVFVEKKNRTQNETKKDQYPLPQHHLTYIIIIIIMISMMSSHIRLLKKNPHTHIFTKNQKKKRNGKNINE